MQVMGLLTWKLEATERANKIEKVNPVKKHIMIEGIFKRFSYFDDEIFLHRMFENWIV